MAELVQLWTEVAHQSFIYSPESPFHTQIWLTGSRYVISVYTSHAVFKCRTIFTCLVSPAVLFFVICVVSMGIKVPEIVSEAKAALAAGHCVVLGLQTTGEVGSQTIYSGSSLHCRFSMWNHLWYNTTFDGNHIWCKATFDQRPPFL